MADQSSDANSETPGRHVKWYVSIWGVVILLASIGPFGLPFLWKSKQFSLFWKWFLTISLVVLTVALSWGSWVLIKQVIDQMRGLGLL